MPHIPRLILPLRGNVSSRADFTETCTTTDPEHELSDDERDPCSDLSPVRTGSPRPGSSCYALREAVANLTFWDDFEAEKIGSGFFADVYKIRHHGNGKVMVVKISKSRNNRQNQQKMLQELELLNKLHHPNVVRYMGACVKDGHIHPLLEYISGGPLEDVLKDQRQSLSWQQKASLATDIARGMEYLHSRNVCHRDLKSENCLVRKLADGNLEAIVSDFGLARVLKFDGDDMSPEQESPRRMSLVGSPYWMAPEILRGEEYTKTVDVFSFGIIICEIMARTTADPDDLPRTNLFGLDVDGFKKLCPDCPANMLQLAADCCSMDPTERPSFTEIYHRLCYISHKMSTSTVKTTNNIPDVDKATTMTTEDGTIINDDSCGDHQQVEEEMTLDSTHYESEKETKSVNNNREDISEKSTTHESISDVQNLAPRTSKTCTRVMRALYILSAVSVLTTLAVLNFWQSLYTLIFVIMSLLLVTLFSVTIKNWWEHTRLTLKVSGLLHDLGRRLSWSSSGRNPTKTRRVGVSGIDMLELKSKKNGRDRKQPPCQDEDHSDDHIGTIDPKQDVFTNNSTMSPDVVSKETASKDMSLEFDGKDLPTKPNVLRSRRRLSKTLCRAGSFGLYDSIEEHADESKA